MNEAPSPRQLEALRRLVGALARRAAGEPVREADLPAAADLPARLVRLHHLGPLAYRIGYEPFRPDYLANSVLAAQRDEHLAEAASALRAGDVPVALLKGVSYVDSLYPDPGERPMADLDLLVPWKKHTRARALLADLGYREAGPAITHSRLHHEATLVRGPVTIDLHRSMLQPWRARLDLGGIWRRAQEAPRARHGAFRLSAVDEALLHLLHIAVHELHVPAVSYIEAAALLSKLSDEERALLDRRAREYRVRRAIQAALRASAALREERREIDWRGPPGHGFLPQPDALLGLVAPGRAAQIARKFLLLDRPPQIVGLGLVFAIERIEGRWHARSLVKERL